MTDRLIRLTTALAVATVAAVAAVISCRHAYELVRSHSETGVTARLVPSTVDGFIWGGEHAHSRRQPAQPTGTTPGALAPVGRSTPRNAHQSRGGWA
jgi:hypothetical protein